MNRDSTVDGIPTSPRRPRGRPRKEAIEKENLSKVLQSNLPKNVSTRFLQKMVVLQVFSLLYFRH